MSVFRDEIEAAKVAASEQIARLRLQVPIDVAALAKSLGVVAIEPRPMTADGYLGRTLDGNLVIRYRDNASLQRTRFTLAHEVAHILLAHAQGKVVTGEAFREEGENGAEECAANQIAAAILMPSHLLLPRVRSRAASWRVMNELRRFFDVSTTAFVRRLLELPGFPVVWGRVLLGQHNDPDTPRVKFSTSCSPSILFFDSPGSLAMRIELNTNAGHRTSLAVEAGGTRLILHGDCRLVDGIGDPELWLVAWPEPTQK